MKNPFRYNRTRVAVVLIGCFTLGNLPAILAGDWATVTASVTVLTVVVAVGGGGFFFGRASMKAEQTYRAEIDAYRQLDGYQPPTVFDLTVNDGAPYCGITEADLTTCLTVLGVPGTVASAEQGEYVTDDGVQLAWTPSTTDTGDNR